MCSCHENKSKSFVCLSSPCTYCSRTALLPSFPRSLSLPSKAVFAGHHTTCSSPSTATDVLDPTPLPKSPQPPSSICPAPTSNGDKLRATAPKEFEASCEAFTLTCLCESPFCLPVCSTDIDPFISSSAQQSITDLVKRYVPSLSLNPQPSCACKHASRSSTKSLICTCARGAFIPCCASHHSIVMLCRCWVRAHTHPWW